MSVDTTMTAGTIDPANPLDQPLSKKDHVLAEYQKQTTVHGTTVAKAFYDGENLIGLDPGKLYPTHQGPASDYYYSRPHHAGLRCR